MCRARTWTLLSASEFMDSPGGSEFSMTGCQVMPGDFLVGMLWRELLSTREREVGKMTSRGSFSSELCGPSL